LFVVGQIMGTHGIKGELKVKQLTDFEERFDVGNSVYIKNEQKVIQLKINGSRQTNKGWLLHFENYDSINDVQFLQGKELYITEEEQTELEEHAYYYHEIIGCKVETVEGEHIGHIDSILAPGANDVWVVKNQHKEEYLIPYIKDVVIEVNINKKLIKIKLLEGLLE